MSLAAILNAIRELSLRTVVKVTIDGREYTLVNPRLQLVWRDGVLVEIRLTDGTTTIRRRLIYEDGVLVEITGWELA